MSSANPVDHAAEAGALIEAIRITKKFGGVPAVRDVDFHIRPGEVHGFVGANGAGKSTIIRILAGIYQPDAGLLRLDGRPVTIHDPGHAHRLGLSFIHQELNLVPEFSSVQNMMLGLEKPTTIGILRWRAIRSQVQAVARRLGIAFPLDVAVKSLSVAERWMVSIGSALMGHARLIAMDEPTASLSADETQRLFQIVAELSASGVAVIFVTHRLDEILELCHRVTVFRDGSSVATLQGDGLNRQNLVRGIVGRDLAALEPAPAHVSTRRVLLEVRGLQRQPAVKDVSFVLHAGEILGLAGLVGSGRTEVARMAFGADRKDAGQILLDGTPLRGRHPQEAIERGIALVPEERRSQGLILRESLAFNINLAFLDSLKRVRSLPMINLRKARIRATQMVNVLNIKTKSIEAPVVELSGGNQQKVVIGKWLIRDARVVILDEPTRGVDIGTRSEIYRLMRAMADGGKGVLVISSEFAELSVCDRVLVMVEGRVVGELHGEGINETAILEMCYSVAAGSVTRPASG